MTRRKKRLPVVLDTNVLVRAFKAASNTNGIAESFDCG